MRSGASSTTTHARVSLEDVAKFYRRDGQLVALEGNLVPGSILSTGSATLEVSVRLTGVEALAAVEALAEGREGSKLEDVPQQIASPASAGASPVSFSLRIDVFASAPPLVFAKVNDASADSATPRRQPSAAHGPSSVATPEVLDAYDGASVCSWLEGSPLDNAPHIYSASLLLPVSLSASPLFYDEAAVSLLDPSRAWKSNGHPQRPDLAPDARTDTGVSAEASSGEKLRTTIVKRLRQKLEEIERRRDANRDAASSRLPGDLPVLGPVRLSLWGGETRGAGNAATSKTLDLAITLPHASRGEQRGFAGSSYEEGGDALLAAVDRAFGSAAAAGASAPQKVLLLVSLQPPPPAAVAAPESAENGFPAKGNGEAETKPVDAKNGLPKPSAAAPACALLSANPNLLKTATATEAAVVPTRGRLSGDSQAPSNEVSIHRAVGGNESGEASTVDVVLSPDTNGISLIRINLDSMQNGGEPAQRGVQRQGKGGQTEEIAENEEGRKKSESLGTGLLFVELDDASPEEIPQVLVCQKPYKSCTGISSFRLAPFLDRGSVPGAYRAPLLLYQEERERALSPFSFFPQLRTHWLLPLLLLPTAGASGSEGETGEETRQRGEGHAQGVSGVTVLLLFPPAMKGKKWNFRFGVLRPRPLTVGSKDTQSARATSTPVSPVSPVSSNSPASPSSPNRVSPPAPSPSSPSPAPPTFLWLFLLLFISSAAMLTAVKLVLYMDTARLSRPANAFLPSVFPGDLDAGASPAAGDSAGLAASDARIWRSLSPSPAARASEAAAGEGRSALASFAPLAPFALEKSFRSPFGGATQGRSEGRRPLLFREDDARQETGDRAAAKGAGLVRLPSWEKAFSCKDESPFLELQETTQKGFRLLSSGKGGLAEAPPRAWHTRGQKTSAHTPSLWRESPWEVFAWPAFPTAEAQGGAETAREGFALGAERAGRDRDSGASGPRETVATDEAALFDTLFSFKDEKERKAEEKEMETTRTATSREKDSTHHSGDEPSEFPSFPDLTPSFGDTPGTPFSSDACSSRADGVAWPFDENSDPFFCASEGSKTSVPASLSSSMESQGAGGDEGEAKRGRSRKAERASEMDRERFEQCGEERVRLMREPDGEGAKALWGADGPEWRKNSRRGDGDTGRRERGVGEGRDRAPDEEGLPSRNWRRIVDPLGDSGNAYEVTYRGDSALVEVATTTEGDEADGRQESLLCKYSPDEEFR